MSTTAAELASARAAFADRLPDTCRVSRWSQASDTEGGWGDTYTPDAATVPCRIAPSGLNALEQPVAGRVGVVQFFTVTLAHDVAVAAPDRIAAETGALAGRTFQAVGPGGRSTPFSRRIDAVEVG